MIRIFTEPNKIKSRMYSDPMFVSSQNIFFSSIQVSEQVFIELKNAVKLCGRKWEDK